MTFVRFICLEVNNEKKIFQSENAFHQSKTKSQIIKSACKLNGKSIALITFDKNLKLTSLLIWRFFFHKVEPKKKKIHFVILLIAYGKENTQRYCSILYVEVFACCYDVFIALRCITPSIIFVYSNSFMLNSYVYGRR